MRVICCTKCAKSMKSPRLHDEKSTKLQSSSRSSYSNLGHGVRNIFSSSSFIFFRITFTYQGVADQKTSEILGTYDRLEKVWSHVRTSI